MTKQRHWMGSAREEKREFDSELDSENAVNPHTQDQ